MKSVALAIIAVFIYSTFSFASEFSKTETELIKQYNIAATKDKLEKANTKPISQEEMQKGSITSKFKLNNFTTVYIFREKNKQYPYRFVAIAKAAGGTEKLVLTMMTLGTVVGSFTPELDKKKQGELFTRLGIVGLKMIDGKERKVVTQNVNIVTRYDEGLGFAIVIDSL